MIPRRVRRLFDQRDEPRGETASAAAVEWRGTVVAVQLLNRSASGAMVAWSEMPHIGEAVRLRIGSEDDVVASVQWVRDGRIGLHFTDGVR